MTTMKINFSIAAALVASPWWLKTLAEVSTVAAILLPIFGLALAVMQIIRLLLNWRGKP